MIESDAKFVSGGREQKMVRRGGDQPFPNGSFSFEGFSSTSMEATVQEKGMKTQSAVMMNLAIDLAWLQLHPSAEVTSDRM